MSFGLVPPVDLMGTLQGSLTPEGVMTQMEQLAQQQVQSLIEQRKQAESAASQAEQEFTDAAAQAPPEVPAGQQAIDLLFGNVASVIAQDPRFRESAHERILNQRNSLMKARADNLAALRDVYQQRAAELEKIGDPASLDMRLKMDQLDKQREQLLEKMKLDARAQGDRDQRAHDREMELLRQRGRMEEALFEFQLETESGEANEEIDSFADAVVSGEISPTGVPMKIRGKVLKRIRDRGEVILPPKVRDSVGALGAAMGVLDQIERLSLEINTAEEGVGNRLTQGLGALRDEAGQVRPEVSVFQAMTKGLLSTISRSTGEVGVLTDADISRARNLLPTIWDTETVAKDKMQGLRQFLRVRMWQLRRAHTTAGAGISEPGTEPAAKTDSSGTKRVSYKLVDGKLVPQ